MKTRTKFVIACIVNAELLFLYMIVCSVFSLAFPPDVFILGWFSLWAIELALLAGIKVKSKDEE